MESIPNQPENQQSQLDRAYDQQWQHHLAYEARARLTLQEKQKEEELQAYLYEINLADRQLLVSQQQQERQALLQQHRAMRIALRKGHHQAGL
ncbi:hypothetical protein [Fibrella aquatica]|uniref:hypothetical protein n=1 Tax=Fibrella aquatica TaxID=3242487 RepID=UPI00352115A5